MESVSDVMNFSKCRRIRENWDWMLFKNWCLGPFYRSMNKTKQNTPNWILWWDRNQFSIAFNWTIVIIGEGEKHQHEKWRRKTEEEEINKSNANEETKTLSIKKSMEHKLTGASSSNRH